MATEGQKRRAILVVDDEDSVRKVVRSALEKDGYDVIDSWGGPDAITKAAQEKFDAAILDIRMPGMTGFDVMHVMKRMSPDTILIILTAMPDPASQFAGLAEQAGVFAYLQKPCKLRELRDTLTRAFAQADGS